MRGLQVGAVAVLILLLVIAGCGSSASGGETEEAAPRLSRQALVNRLGDICQAHTDQQVIEIQHYERTHGIPSEKATGAQLEQELVRVILPIVHDTIQDVRQLRPPAGDEAKLEAFIEALEDGVATSKKDPSWIATGDFEPFMRAREAAGALKAYYCGQA